MQIYIKKNIQKISVYCEAQRLNKLMYHNENNDYTKKSTNGRHWISRRVLTVSAIPNKIVSFVHKKISKKHSHSQTVIVRDLNLKENVHSPPCVTCHMSHVTFHMSGVSRHGKRHNFYTNKFCAKIILPEKVRKLLQNLILNKTA